MATYKQIQDYIREKYNFTAKTCWIAHMKELHNLPLAKAHNRLSADKRTQPCPESKQVVITEAFTHFGMV